MPGDIDGNVQKLDRGRSGRLAIVETQEPAEALPA
jgi:hypothetical protein